MEVLLFFIGIIFIVMLISWYIEERKEFDEDNRFFGEWIFFILLIILLSVFLSK
jgi:hypothetical protein